MESTVWEELTAAPKSCSWGISSAATQAGLKMLHQWSVPSVCRQLQQHLGQLQRTRACSCSVLTATAQVGFHIPQCFHTYVQSFRFVLVGNNESTSKKPNVCSAVYSKQVLHLGGTPAARAWRDQCLCTQSELRIVLISPDTAPEPVQNPAASPCSEHTALGNQNQHQAGVSSVTPCPGSPFLPALSLLCCGSAPSFLPQDGFAPRVSVQFQRLRRKFQVQPQLGVLVVLAPPRPSADFSFPVSRTEVFFHWMGSVLESHWRQRMV